MKVLDKIDELELNEDYVKVIISKHKDNWDITIWEKVGSSRYDCRYFVKYLNGIGVIPVEGLDLASLGAANLFLVVYFVVKQQEGGK